MARTTKHNGVAVTTQLNTLMISLFVACLPIPCGMAEEFSVVEVPEVARDKVICFALYTVDHHVMKMTAQLYPLEQGESRRVYLDIERRGEWKQAAESKVIQQGWVALFRIEPWDNSRDIRYRLRHDGGATYTGTIKRDPVERDEIVVAAFTGNSIYVQHGGDIARDDIVENIRKLKPDLLFFSGDQVYDHTHHYAYWLKFGRDFGDIIRDTPTITIPDDHDRKHLRHSHRRREQQESPHRHRTSCNRGRRDLGRNLLTRRGTRQEVPRCGSLTINR